MIEIKKKICRRCTRYRYDSGILYCGATAKTLTHYSTGESEVVYDECDRVNMSGDCSMFVYSPTVWESIRPWFNYRWIAWVIIVALLAEVIFCYWRLSR